VTGGGTGIGEEMALVFADHGADVAVASRDMDHLEPVAAEIEAKGQDACATTVDVRERDEVDAMRGTVLKELGDISILVNNAGANFLTPLEDLSANGWRAVVGTILDGTAFCTMSVGEDVGAVRRCWPLLRHGRRLGWHPVIASGRERGVGAESRRLPNVYDGRRDQAAP
ncbi:hypothetical protein BRC63_07950, partial [Halobacteriales archaeon QH_10_70_21]